MRITLNSDILVSRAETQRSVPAKIGYLFIALILAVCVGCESHKKEAWETAPLKDGEIEVVRLAEMSGLTIDRVRFYARELSKPRFFLALLPKTDKPLERVLIVNHGWFDRPEYLLTYLHVDQAYAKLLKEGAVKPAILVLPDVRFDDYFRRNSAAFPFAQYLTLVAEEVSGVVSEHYHVPFVRENWGICGFSFGGYLSLDVGRRYSGRFGSVGVISSFFNEDWLFWPDKVPANEKVDPKGRGMQTIVESGPIPRLLLACGTSDRFYKIMIQLHQKFQKLGIPHSWSTGPGGHTWAYWSSVLEELLKFHLGN